MILVTLFLMGVAAYVGWLVRDIQHKQALHRGELYVINTQSGEVVDPADLDKSMRKPKFKPSQG